MGAGCGWRVWKTAGITAAAAKSGAFGGVVWGWIGWVGLFWIWVGWVGLVWAVFFCLSCSFLPGSFARLTAPDTAVGYQ